jgi:hypothetical protein
LVPVLPELFSAQCADETDDKSNYWNALKKSTASSRPYSLGEILAHQAAAALESHAALPGSPSSGRRPVKLALGHVPSAAENSCEIFSPVSSSRGDLA